jgi:hypothetical protein
VRDGADASRGARVGAASFVGVSEHTKGIVMKKSGYLAFTILGAACSSGPPSSSGTEANSVEQTTQALSSASSASSPGLTRSRDAWRKTMSKTPLPKEGCFQATHPSTTWEEVPCTTAPNVPYAPAKRHGGGGETVGNGTDESAQVSGTISWAEGSFPTVTGVTSETDGTANNFSLQLNSNFFSGEALCSGARTPSSCQGWQQFIYAPSAVFMQFWLLDYVNACPAGWNTFGTDCFKNSSTAASVPTQAITNLVNLSLSGNAGSTDTVTMWAGNTLYATSQASVLGLNKGWTTAEFNIVGNANSTQAVFNAGATIFVQTLTDSVTPTGAAPSCESEGFTGETNSLTLVPGSCCPVGGQLPGIVFTQSNSWSGGPPACPPANISFGSAGHLGGYSRSDGHSAIDYANPSAHVAELSLSGHTWSFGDLTHLTGAPGPAGDIANYVRSDVTNAVVYRSSDGHIRELSLPVGATSWHAGDLISLTGGTASAGNPSGYVRSDAWSTVVYRGTDAHIHELGLAPGSTSWQVGDLTALTGAPNASGDPIGFVRNDLVNAVVFQSASDNHIRELKLAHGSGSWATDDLTALTGATAAAGKARGFVRSDGFTSVVYRGTDNHIHELGLAVGSSTWQVGDLSTLTGATAASGDPAPYVRADEWSTVVYLGSDGHIHELGLAPASSSWQVGDLTSLAGAPSASAGPTGYVRADFVSTVDFQSSDNHIHELQLTSTGWTQADLTSLAGGP